ncbi:hypothetical protein Tco_1288405, partial [Tanacetum coccineum]
STTTTTIPTTTFLEIPNFASIFGFERRVSSLETELSELKQTNQFAKALSSIPGIVDNYLTSKMKDAVNVAIQLQSNKLREEAQAENEKFLIQIDSNVKAIIKDQVKAQVSKIIPKVEKYVIESLGAEVLARSSNQPQTYYAAVASLSEFELKKILIDKIEENKSMNRSDIQKNLYNTLIESYKLDKDLFASYGDVVTLKRGSDDQDKDEEPSVGSNRGTKRRRSGKEELSKEATQKESKSTSSSKGASRSQLKSSDKSAQAEEHGLRVDDLEEPLHQEFNIGNDDVSPVRKIIVVDEQLWNPSGSQTLDHEWNKTKTATPIDFSAFIMNRLKLNNLTQDVLTGLTYDLMKGMWKSVVELEYHLEENARGHQVIPFDYFINNDLEYLKGGSSSKKYTTSITKMKAADYGHVQWIEDKVPRNSMDMLPTWKRLTMSAQDTGSLPSPVSRSWSSLATNILNLYKFREGDFKRLQRVEDLQLAVESYQKKINLSKPDTYRSDLQKMTPYTAYYDIQGIIYQDDMNRNHLMRTDELHKFSDNTLNHVRTTLNDIATGIQIDYLPKIK